MTEQGNDESRGAPEAGPPAYGTPPPYGTPPYGTPPEQGTHPFGSVPPTAAYPAQAGYPAQQPHPGQGGYPGAWQGFPEPSQGVLALVLGIIGLFVFWPLAPVAWVIGRHEVRAVDAGRRDPANRGLGVAGMVMGIIGTVLLAIGIVVFVLAIIALVAASSSSAT